MYGGEMMKLIRDCEATQVPSGEKLTLAKGTQVKITQSLGGTYTVITEQGFMVSIAEKDGDALGKEVVQAPKIDESKLTDDVIEKLVWEQLKTCYDPEIPHNIVDLGLIYDCQISSAKEGRKVDINMTLTAPGCGMGDWLAQDARTKILTIPTINDVNIEIVFDPPWDQSKMSPALRRQLNM